MVGYAEAFKTLGYYISSPISDVSSEKEDGVVIAIMRHELRYENKRTIFDTRQIPDWEKMRMSLPGNTRRRAHLSKAVDKFGGLVDVILYDKPVKGNGDAEIANRPNSRWVVTYFDEITGHHRVELQPN
ncbi:MAG: hypothetical protein LDL37_08675 [Asticcacaulis sp.]|uniref:hypothetical protein n=1 Tax=Asticcacaulis sp. TaxID=1872648 RepID=UPI0025BC8BA8|nr:hypothetical protein [Asticcacaulis sp.]MCA1935513.1 hypothetical protein [Asticcacaulis sp.]